MRFPLVTRRRAQAVVDVATAGLRAQLAAERDITRDQAAEILRLRDELAARPAEPAKVTALREELNAQKRVNKRLSDQLLDAVGHNAEALTADQRRILGIPAGGAR